MPAHASQQNDIRKEMAREGSTSGRGQAKGSVLLSSTTKRKPVQKLLGYVLSFLALYYPLLVFAHLQHAAIGYTSVTLLAAPIGLGLLGFGSACLAKILLDISGSNQSKIHEESYHELLSDIRMAKEDLRSKGISVD
ncbi:hypothetical protein PTTG_27726 [Puccinia triticina 1-1 BBBD Race 1]|uniref:Dolichol-phosphate mannosyltransferase subunit 3 n=2 Tax=Puccinia triticina TaxID=208348 RepID=A0A180GJK4_PUCT1|nr:uncharacterized protein PtA15_3A291 [Puccinia triticina]OAV92143.1 hypothetical protein PTTG_27726 [Puccinia triticina 1-1 BBBD Race 1]WAQ82926.1 hypothetical protein PtA15_3A291 [Puccinia triticina]WAR53750.1 hypothetical protein PtB15_3B259 [Puccinia triticina]